MVVVEAVFKQVVADFFVALEGLTECKTITTVTGVEMTMQPLIVQVQASLSAIKTAAPPSAAYRSKPPLWVSGLDWEQRVRDIFVKVLHAAGVHGAEVGKDRALWDLAAQVVLAPLAPPMVQVLVWATRNLQQCEKQARGLLYPPMFEIVGACPVCGAEKVVVYEGGGQTLRTALTVHEFWAECAGCGHEWIGGDIVDYLAPMLNPQGI